MNANNNADSPSSVQGSVSSGQKKRKRKANKETQSQLAVRSNSPYSAVPINTYEKFLNLFMVKMNSNIAESLNELKYHYIDKCHFVIRHYNRSDYSKPAPTNPIGAPNYIEMTGVDDYHGSISRYLEAMPDYTIIFSDMTIQTLHTKTILMAKCSQQSTLISHIPVPKTMQLDHAIDALALNAKNELQDVRVASEDMDTIRKLVLQVDIIQRDKISERAVFLPQAPQILVQTLPLQALSSIPLSPPSPPSPPSTLSPSTSTDSSISSAQLGVASPEEGVEYKLVAMPVRMKGWFVVHFLDHDVTKISKVEAHYYTPLEVT